MGALHIIKILVLTLVMISIHLKVGPSCKTVSQHANDLSAKLCL